MTILLEPPMWWRFIRVRQWYYFAFLPLACAAPDSWWSAGRLLLCFALAAGSLAFAYGLNALTDAATDHDLGKNPLAGGQGVSQPMMVLLWTFPVCVLCASWWMGALTATMAAASLLAGWLYSGPFRLKRHPFAGLLCNHAIFVPLLYFGGTWEVLGSWNHLSMVAGCITLLTQNQLIHELADWGEDVEAGDRTTGQWLHRNGTLFFCYLVGVGSAAAALFLPAPLSLVGSISLLAATGAIWVFRHSPPAARKAHRWVGLIGSGFYYVATIA